jgi:hypothetical protein
MKAIAGAIVVASGVFLIATIRMAEMLTFCVGGALIIIGLSAIFFARDQK